MATILAGGQGTRLWPLARSGRPKQFLRLVRGRSLFQATCDRIGPIVRPERMIVVTGAAHAHWVRKQAPRIPDRNLIVEATGRNTAASVALAALRAVARYGDAIMIVLPADQVIAPAAAFRAAVHRGLRAVRQTGGMLMFGVRPSRPDVGFGYIRPTGPPVARGVRLVAAFVEKPRVERARAMTRSGRYLWNSGIFIWKASTILEALRRHRPDVVGPAEAWAKRRRRESSWVVPATVLRRIASVSIDRAVLERSKGLLVARAAFDWSDLGTWTALADRLPGDRRGNAGLGGLIAVDSAGCLGINPGGATVFVGVRDIVAVHAGDVVLVCHRGAAQRMRDAVARLVGGLRRHR